MATENRAARDDLILAFPNPQALDFFQFLRMVECRYRDKPRIGAAVTTTDEAIRLAQDPELDFAPSSISSLTASSCGLPPRLGVRFFGLFGPDGPMPLHITEYARERIHHHNDETFSRFADIFHHRMLSLFYRAWANARPAVSFDRPESDRFAFYVACLTGFGLPALTRRDAMPDRAKYFLSGLLSGQTKHAEGLASLLRAFFDLRVAVEEFIGEWMDIPEEDWLRLGDSARGLGFMGQSAVLGATVFGCQHKFRVVLGPMSLVEYRALLPGGHSLVQLLAVVRNYVGDELVWDANLRLKAEDVPPLALDGSIQLGWTSWLGQRGSAQPAGDLLLNPFFSTRRGQS